MTEILSQEPSRKLLILKNRPQKKALKKGLKKLMQLSTI
jgi:hypothetical protein